MNCEQPGSAGSDGLIGSSRGSGCLDGFSPKTGSAWEWHAAYDRVEDYLRGLRILDPAQQSRIILRMLALAATRHAENPELCPTSLALEETCASIDRWFEQIPSLGESGSIPGLLSLLATDAARKWPAAFLAEDAPLDFQHALLENPMHLSPVVNRSRMVPEPFVSPLADMAGLPGSWRKLLATFLDLPGAKSQ